MTRLRQSYRRRALRYGGQAGGQKGKQTMKKKLHEAIKGMQVESWEVRERSNGTRKVYVRFTQKEPVVTVDVNQSEE